VSEGGVTVDINQYYRPAILDIEAKGGGKISVLISSRQGNSFIYNLRSIENLFYSNFFIHFTNSLCFVSIFF